MKFLLVLILFTHSLVFAGNSKAKFWELRLKKLTYQLKNNKHFYKGLTELYIKKGFSKKQAEKFVNDFKNSNVRISSLDNGTLEINMGNDKAQDKIFIDYSKDLELIIKYKDKNAKLNINNLDLKRVNNDLFGKEVSFNPINLFVDEAYAGITIATGVVLTMAVVAAIDFARERGLFAWMLKKLYYSPTLGGDFCCKVVQETNAKIKQIEELTYSCISDLTKVFNDNISFSEAKKLRTVNVAGRHQFLSPDKELLDFVNNLSGDVNLNILGEAERMLNTCNTVNATFEIKHKDVENLELVNNGQCVEKFKQHRRLYSKNEDLLYSFQTCMKTLRDPTLRSSANEFNTYKDKNRDSAKDIIKNYQGSPAASDKGTSKE